MLKKLRILTEPRATSSGLNHVDLVFAIDTTGSMGPFIAEARRQLIACMEALGARRGIDLRVGIVEYRDHPPQEPSFVTRMHELTSDLDRARRAIDRLQASGGGDAPEAVYDGIHVACTESQWRPASSRFVVLVGDAPPHGRGGPEGACTCGLTAARTTAAAEARRVVVHALPIARAAETVGAFTELAIPTGGQCSAVGSAGDVIGAITKLLDADFADLDFDARVLATVRGLGDLDADRIGEALACSPLAAAASLARLGRRGMLSDETADPAAHRH